MAIPLNSLFNGSQKLPGLAISSGAARFGLVVVLGAIRICSGKLMGQRDGNCEYSWKPSGQAVLEIFTINSHEA